MQKTCYIHVRVMITQIISIEQRHCQHKNVKITVLDVIDQTRGRVFHQDIQTPRSVLKNEAISEFFSMSFEIVQSVFI